MAQESPAARASQIARQMLLFGRPVSNEELMERLANLTPQRLSDLAGKLFFDTPITVSAIGPVDAICIRFPAWPAFLVSTAGEQPLPSKR
jgi:predicted Zn-dependent peptidase